MRLFFVWILVFAGLMGAWPLRAYAQELTLESATSRALANHPALRAQDAQTSAREQQAVLDAMAPPLVIGGELENFAGSGLLRGTSATETSLRLSRVIERGGKREARVALGHAEVSRQRHAAKVTRIEVATETSRRFLEVLAAQSRVALAQQSVTYAKQMQTQVTRWVEAGRNPDSDRHQAEIALGQAYLALEDAEHELLTARLALSSLWGERKPSFSVASGTLETLPVMTEFNALAMRLPDNIEQQSFDHDIASLDAQHQAAIASIKPDVSLSLGVRRLEAVNAQALIASLSIPLGNTPRAELGMARISAEQNAVTARREAASDEAYQTLFALYQEALHARHVFESHRDSLVPKAAQAVAVNERGYRLGRFGFPVLIQSQQQLIALRSVQLEAAARYHALLVDIERLTTNAGVTTP